MAESVNVRIRLDDDQMAALRGQVRQVAEHYAGELERLRVRLRETEDPLAEVIRKADAEWWQTSLVSGKTRSEHQAAAVRAHIAAVIDVLDHRLAAPPVHPPDEEAVDFDEAWAAALDAVREGLMLDG